MPARGPRWIFHTARFACVLYALLAAQAQTRDPRTAVKPPVLVSQAGLGREDDFHRTIRQSGLIFDGTVTAVQCERGNDRKTPQSYRVTFRVKQGVRGVRTGAAVTIREWAGIWPVGSGQMPRYHPGERAFLFFYPTSRAGLTSTVGGNKGKLIVQAGQVTLSADWAKTLTPPTPRVSASWLAAQIVNTQTKNNGGSSVPAPAPHQQSVLTQAQPREAP